MKTDRRNFIRITVAGGVISAITPIANLAATTTSDVMRKGAAKNSLKLNLSFQEGTAPGKSLNEKLDYMEKHGIVGLEPDGGDLAKRINEFNQALRGRNIKISAICAGFKGFILSPDTNIRSQFMNSMKEIITAAGELGSIGVIMVPAFNGQKPVLPNTLETREMLVSQLKELGDFAVKHKTSVILEPLNRNECFYLRQVSNAAAICNDVASKGVTCMGDFWHMKFEEPSARAAFLSAGTHLSHVHIASLKRRSMPGEDGAADNYIDGFKGLKEIGYNNYVSFECGCQGDKQNVLPNAIKLIKDQWNKA